MMPPVWSVEVFSDEEVIFKPGANILEPSRITLDVDTGIVEKAILTHSRAGISGHPSLTQGTPL